jgi:hypothetical protein
MNFRLTTDPDLGYKETTMTNKPTTSQLRSLRTEARLYGDPLLVAACDVCLASPDRVIAARRITAAQESQLRATAEQAVADALANAIAAGA